MRDTY
jgi:hypothetical protein